MYTDGRRQKKPKPVIALLVILVLVTGIIAGLFWWFFVRGNTLQTTSINAETTTTTTASVPTTEFKTELFLIELPSTWVANGRKNPVSDSVYYEYQNTLKNYDNRYLRIYVDTFPSDVPLNHLLPVTVVNARIVPAVVSEECSTFSTPPNLKPSDPKPDYVQAKWQGVTFVCDLKQFDRKIGTASAEEGYGVTVTSSNGTKHRYFFVYIERNVRPDFQFLPDVVKSFRTL